jgi:hypothetical protein
MSRVLEGDAIPIFNPALRADVGRTHVGSVHFVTPVQPRIIS